MDRIDVIDKSGSTTMINNAGAYTVFLDGKWGFSLSRLNDEPLRVKLDLCFYTVRVVPINEPIPIII